MTQAKFSAPQVQASKLVDFLAQVFSRLELPDGLHENPAGYRISCPSLHQQKSDTEYSITLSKVGVWPSGRALRSGHRV